MLYRQNERKEDCNNDSSLYPQRRTQCWTFGSSWSSLAWKMELVRCPDRAGKSGKAQMSRIHCCQQQIGSQLRHNSSVVHCTLQTWGQLLWHFKSAALSLITRRAKFSSFKKVPQSRLPQVVLLEHRQPLPSSPIDPSDALFYAL